MIQRDWAIGTSWAAETDTMCSLGPPWFWALPPEEFNVKIFKIILFGKCVTCYMDVTVGLLFLHLLWAVLSHSSFVRQLARLILAFAEMCLAPCGCLLSEDLLSVVTDYFVIATAELILQWHWNTSEYMQQVSSFAVWNPSFQNFSCHEHENKACVLTFSLQVVPVWIH